jgi:hypothetical protein
LPNTDARNVREKERKKTEVIKNKKEEKKKDKKGFVLTLFHDIVSTTKIIDH